MRATRAYIASAGTATVMLAASLATFALVSALVAFGAWPGTGGARPPLDQVLVSNVVKAKPRPIAVRADAHPSETAQRASSASHARTRTAAAHSATSSGSRTRSRTQPTDGASAPTAASAPASTSGLTAPATAVNQGTRNLAQTVDTTTRDLTGRATQPVQNAADQVGNVVNQVTAPVQQTAAPAVQPVQDTAGSVLPH